MASRTIEWRLRTSTGQELAISAGGEAAGGDEYPSVFLDADLEAWWSGDDPWARRALGEMYEAVRGGLGGDHPPDVVLPAVAEAFRRGELLARLRAPAWEFPRGAEREPEEALPPDAVDPAPVREQRRITVRLGDLDAVFEPVTSVRGKKQRLQALGHYYEVITPSTAADATEAYKNCLAYWQAKRERALGRAFADAAEMEKDLQSQVRQFVVAGGALPGVGGEVKVRLPGTFLIENMDAFGDQRAPNGKPLPSLRFEAENALWNGHGALGKIPIVARVEVRRGKSWMPAGGERVHFQLVPPFHDDPRAELADVEVLRNTSQRPAIRGYQGGAPEPAGPRQFITNAIQHAFDPNDPQRYNAHESRGGKRGRALLGNVFDRLPDAKFPDMRAPETATASAVRAATNAAGEAGVLFLPARTAGDRYRLRISVEADDGAVSFETGRLCVWRHFLWSHFLVKPPPHYPPADTVRGVQARLATLCYDVGELDDVAGPRTEEAVRSFQRAYPPLAQNGRWDDGPTNEAIDRRVHAYLEGGDNYKGIGPTPGVPDFGAVAATFRQMYWELEVEPEASNIANPRLLTPDRYRTALRWAIAQVEAMPPGTYGGAGLRDIAAMVSEEFETPFLFAIRHPSDYDRRRRATSTPAGGHWQSYWKDAAFIVHHDSGLTRHFLRYLTAHPSDSRPPAPDASVQSTPGLMILSALAPSPAMFMPKEPDMAKIKPIPDAQHGGESFPERASAVYAGRGVHARSSVYRGDAVTNNVLHEIGHQLYLRHQFEDKPPWTHANNAYREDHHSPTTIVDPLQIPAPVPYDRCLMGYLPCEGQLCGKCHLKLRGWDITRMPT